jgi:ribosomal protein L35
MKTNKSITKRFKITGKKKLMRKKASQNHFNAKDPGSKTMKKRRLQSVSSSYDKTFKKFIRSHI